MNAYQVYRNTQAQTATPSELVVMLYRGAVRFVATGIQAMEQRQIEPAHVNLTRAQAIISELLETLDLERGGELSKNLVRIYEYLNYRLVEANMRKDPEPAREVERHLRELLAAWEHIVTDQKAASARQLSAVGA